MMQEWDDALSVMTSTGDPFLGQGLRSYGVVTIYGYEQAQDLTNEQSDWLDASVLLFGELMDGSFIGLHEGFVIFVNQMEPEYEDDWRKSHVRSPLTLKELCVALETEPEKLPQDFWQALKLWGTFEG